MSRAQPTHEARIRALEDALHPGSLGRTSGVPLKEHFETRIAELEKATVVASNAMDRRLDGMNEFRDTLRDQAGRFVTQNEVRSQLDVINAKIHNLEKFQAVVEGKASMSSVYISYIMAAIGIAIGIIGLLGG